MKKITQILLLSFLLALAGINFSSAQTQVLFGTCYSGGNSGWGTIFQADLNGNNLSTVYSFLNPEGAMPWGKIAQASNGKVYGVTFLGGCADSCTLYEYDPIAHTCVDVYDFYCNTPIGEPSQGGVIILPDGNIYGLQQPGVIYKFNPNTHVYTMLQQTSGANYFGGLMQASDGKLYGASYGGGMNGLGYIFGYDLVTQTYSILYSFETTRGANPYFESLIQGTNGKLYGTTYNGGANNKGVIFSYDLSTNTYTDLHDFDVPAGSNPYSGLRQASNGKLYGVTYMGGTNDYGVIFSYDISASQYTVLYNFDGTNGSNPMGGLTQASNGKLFGTAHGGGTFNGGVAFTYDIAAGTYTVLANFSAATGQAPQCDIQEATIEPTGIASANVSAPSIYVDAATQLLIIQNSKFNSGAKLIIYDAVGKNVFQTEIYNQSQFDLSSYTRGIYFAQLKTGREMVTQKIVLSK
jgi:uncharacterized repeat protein (TIGR03803 family)